MRLSGFYSKPELQKLNRNSIYIFVNKRLIRDRLLLHAITEAYRNIIPPTSSPVVLLFLEMPPEEVDVNVHPAKTEVRFRQQSLVHDFVRDSLRNALIAARPSAGFMAALDSSPAATPSLIPVPISRIPGAPEDLPPDSEGGAIQASDAFQLTPRPVSPVPGKLPFGESEIAAELEQQAFRQVAAALMDAPARAAAHDSCSPDPLDADPLDGAQVGADIRQAAEAATAQVEAEQAAANLNQLGSLRPLGQLRESFILATGDQGLWIIDQHVAHERILFEKILRDRQVEKVHGSAC